MMSALTSRFRNLQYQEHHLVHMGANILSRRQWCLCLLIIVSSALTSKDSDNSIHEEYLFFWWPVIQSVVMYLKIHKCLTRENLQK